MDPWKKIGIHDLKEAKAWKELGCDPIEVKTWKEKFVHLTRAEPWIKEGFTAEGAWRWWYAGFSSSKARQWLDRGMDPWKDLPVFDENVMDDDERQAWGDRGIYDDAMVELKGLGLDADRGAFWDVILGETNIGTEVFDHPRKIVIILMEVLSNKGAYETILKNIIKIEGEKTHE